MEKNKQDYEFADTVFVRDIDGKVFQAIAYRCLVNIEGIELMGGNILDSLLGREISDKMKGIFVDQDPKSHAINLKIEVNIAYGISIPDKSEEIQAKVVKEVTRLTGLHVSSVHIIFKNLISQESLDKMLHKDGEATGLSMSEEAPEYTDAF